MNQIRWHHVPDLDLSLLMQSEDPEIAAAAAEEHQRRRALAGGAAAAAEKLFPGERDS